MCGTSAGFLLSQEHDNAGRDTTPCSCASRSPGNVGAGFLLSQEHDNEASVVKAMLLRRQEPRAEEVSAPARLCLHHGQRRNGTLYLGVTSDLVQRVYQHRNGLIVGFSKRSGCKLLVWYAAFDDIQMRGRASCR